MKVHLLRLLTFLLSMMVYDHCHASPAYEGTQIDLTTYKVVTLYKGADKQQVAQGLDVSGIFEIVSQASNQWMISLSFNTSKTVIEQTDIWLQLRSSINAAEVYLNGHLLLSNGTVGDSKQTEVTGKSLIRQQIPNDYLIDGSNNITVKFSNFHHRQGAVFRDLSLGSLTDLSQNSAVMSTAPMLFSGIFIFALFVNLALYFSLDRKPVFALLATLYLINFVLMANEALYWNGMLNTVSFIDNRDLRGALEALIYFCLLWVIHFEYQLARKYAIGATALFFAAFLVATITNLPITLLFGALALGYGILAESINDTKHWAIMVSLVIVTAFNFVDEYNLIEQYAFVHSHTLITSLVFKLDNLGMIIFALLMIFNSARSILSKTQQLNETQHKLAQLEYQFVKKHIQPHFLMNSLMSLQQLVNKDPETAGQMIEALSEEFHLLTIMSKQNLVPIEQEIDMCRTHLTIMSIQQRASYQLQIEGISGEEEVPPAIFHTLVENGVTHGYSGNENAEFLLSKTTTPHGVSYQLFNDGQVNETPNNKKSSGSGLNYIKARLEAWRPGQWTLSAGKVTGGWQTTIKIKEAP